jgi:hypothetical protein
MPLSTLRKISTLVRANIQRTSRSVADTYHRRRNGNGLARYVGRHRGQRGFVIGNGPSLNTIDMTKLRDEVTLGANRIYLGFADWGFATTYWGIEDLLQIQQGHQEFSEALPEDSIKFVPNLYSHLFATPNVVPVNFIYAYSDYPRFSSDPARLYHGFTVTYMLLQIAAVLGCNPIILVGCDHSYTITDAERVGDHWSDPKSQSHFTAGYCDAEAGRVWNLPQPLRMEAAYEAGRDAANRLGIEILNATPGSQLDVYPRADFEDLF